MAKNILPQIKGFTLVELVIAIVIFGIIAAGVSLLLTQGFRSFFSGRDIVDANWQGQVALERMTRGLRNVRSADYIINATANTISFVDSDGTEISYYVSAGQLLRKSPFLSAGQVLADGVSSLAFTYYDQNGVPLNPVVASNIHYITISLNINYRNVPLTLTTGVYTWNIN